MNTAHLATAIEIGDDCHRVSAAGAAPAALGFGRLETVLKVERLHHATTIDHEFVRQAVLMAMRDKVSFFTAADRLAAKEPQLLESCRQHLRL